MPIIKVIDIKLKLHGIMDFTNDSKNIEGDAF
jgi:hypothetical protein